MTKKLKRSAVARAPTRDLILDEAEWLIAVKGVHGFTLKDISTPLQMQVPAIYKHYESKDDVLVALARRYITLLSQQFDYAPEGLAEPLATLQQIIKAFARFHIAHPAYVRLSLIDFATPQGGMEYIRLAAGGPFRANLTTGPLAPMHRRLQALLDAGARAGQFRAASGLEFYRLVKAVLLLRLVFPDDLLASKPTPAVQRAIEALLVDTAHRYLALDT
jgi:AcrR family transcriptional regulator